jgi:hypothetical protein
VYKAEREVGILAGIIKGEMGINDSRNNIIEGKSKQLRDKQIKLQNTEATPGCEGLLWIEVAHEKFKWWALQFPFKVGKFLI